MRIRKTKINCLDCEHFYVTWDKEFPRGCKAFGFKGKTLPSQSVFNVTNQECPLFQKKLLQNNKSKDGWSA